MRRDYLILACGALVGLVWGAAFPGRVNGAVNRVLDAASLLVNGPGSGAPSPARSSRPITGLK